MKLHQQRKHETKDATGSNNNGQPQAPRYKIRAVYENNFKVGSKQYYGLENSGRSLVFGDSGYSRTLQIKKLEDGQRRSSAHPSPEKLESVIPILYNDVPFRLKTATDDDTDEPPAKVKKAVHSFKLYSLPTAELEAFKKDMACCAHMHKVEYEAHENKARCC